VVSLNILEEGSGAELVLMTTRKEREGGREGGKEAERDGGGGE
jgi:hypothetical protein